MQNSFFNLQKSAATALAALAMLALTACGSNDEPDTIPSAQTFTGTLATTIPAMPDFEPVTSAATAGVTWLDPQQTSATINLSAFTIETGMAGHAYTIGAMEITGVACTKAADGTISLSREAFTCQAGDYEVTGSLEGVCSDDALTFTMTYKPGSMPLEVKSVFSAR